MGPLIAIAIGAVVLIAVMMFAPVIAGTIEESMPNLAEDSQWNASVNTDLPDTADTWTTISGLLVLCAIIIVISIAIYYIRVIM